MEKEIRTYISDPDRRTRNWTGKNEEARAARSSAHEAVYANRHRIKGEHGKHLMKKRGDLIERSFAHGYDTSGMHRTHLREHDNILKRLLIHASGFNLSLILRKMTGFGAARGLQARLRRQWMIAMELCRKLPRSFPIQATDPYAA